jgi:WD40 repeat protein
MFVNMNDVTLPITPSATPTTYAVPNGTTRIRVVNASGGVLVFEGEVSSASTLSAPAAGTRFIGTAMADGTVEMFNVSSNITHISIYSASGTGLVYVQFTTGDK